MTSLVTVSVHTCSHCCWKNISYTQWLLLLLFPYIHVLTAVGKISVTLNDFSSYCFRTYMFSLLLENIGYTQWLLLLLFRYMPVLTAAGKYRLHSMASLVTVSVHTCSHCCWKISVTLNGFSSYCFRTWKYAVYTSEKNVPLSESTVGMGHSSGIYCYWNSWRCLTCTVQNKLRTNCSQTCQRQSFELNDLKF